MKTIGLIGGMSWESSLEYYRIINQVTQAKLGGLHSAPSVMVSVDFAPIEQLQQTSQWDAAGEILLRAAQQLQQAGADCIVLCTNTMHKVADVIQAQVDVPFLHIADATAARVKAAQVQTVGLLGTQFTMEEDFYKGRLIDHYGLNMLIPTKPDRERIHQVIYDELCVGRILSESHHAYIGIMNRLIEEGATGIILGCTEIELLVKPGDVPVPLFPTARIHAEAAVEYAISGLWS